MFYNIYPWFVYELDAVHGWNFHHSWTRFHSHHVLCEQVHRPCGQVPGQTKELAPMNQNVSPIYIYCSDSQCKSKAGQLLQTKCLITHACHFSLDIPGNVLGTVAFLASFVHPGTRAAHFNPMPLKFLRDHTQTLLGFFERCFLSDSVTEPFGTSSGAGTFSYMSNIYIYI